MASHQELQQAIAILEAQRTALGDDVVDTSVAAIRLQLDSIETSPALQQHEDVAVLVADLSDYTAMSEQMDAEELRDTTNALWAKLDSVVTSWGGVIDKHTGDGLIALFGVPLAHDDDAERAILAGLDIQAELRLLNQKRQRIMMPIHNRSLPEYRMRIGIDVGPVFFGRVGMSGDFTAVGDAVSMASQLQEIAPVDSILVSYELYSRVHTLFDVQSLDPVEFEGKTSRLGVYLVKGEKQHGYQSMVRASGFHGARLVGRQRELEQLQAAIQTTMDTGRSRLLAVVGEKGIGKSRLLVEFEQLLKLLPVQVTLLNGRAQRQFGHRPFALIRDIFLNHFGIHTRSSPAVAREKLSQGILATLRKDEPDRQASVHFIGHLLGFDFSHSRHLQAVNHNSHRIREKGFSKIVGFLESVARTAPVTVVLLEDLQWADERSLDLIDYLFQSSRQMPLLIVGTGEPSLYERRPSWKALEDTGAFAYNHIDLEPLSPINSRQLVSEVLHESSQLPLKVTDLIVERTGGNPASIVALTQALLEADAIVKESGQWRLQVTRPLGSPMIPTLPELLGERLEDLSDSERNVLDAAAVLGDVFLSNAVVHLAAENEGRKAAHSIDSDLEALMEIGLIALHRVPQFTGSREYIFRYDDLRQIVYRQLPTEIRRTFHLRAAEWFIEQTGQAVMEFAAVIASHFERSGDIRTAAEWYGRAGAHARDTHAPATAIQYFNRARNLLPPDKSESAKQRLTLNAALAELSRWRAQFNEAVAAYTAMLEAAKSLGDEDAEIQAHVGMFLTHHFQQEHAAALAASEGAAAVAERTGMPAHRAVAMACRAWALTRLDGIDTALELAKEALALSTEAGAQREIAFSNALIGGICRINRWYDQAVRTTETAHTIFRDLGDRVWEALMLGNLGHIAYARRDYPTAVRYFEESWHIARDVGDFYGAMRSLRRLGLIARIRNQEDLAEHYYRKAFVYADKSGNTGYCAFVASDLGKLFLDLALLPFGAISDLEKDTYLQKARTWFESALQLATSAGDVLTLALARAGLAQLLLEEDNFDEAMTLAVESLTTAGQKLDAHPGRMARETMGITWRVLAQVIRELPSGHDPVVVSGSSVDVAHCFSESLRTLSEIGYGGEVESAYTLLAWASYEIYEGDRNRGESLWKRATDMFARSGMEREANWMRQSAQLSSTREQYAVG